MSLRALPLILILATLALIGLMAYLRYRHTVLQFNKPKLDLARCRCGEPIRGCDHKFGVPSTFQHVSDRRHFHDDGSMVEHA